MTLNDIFRVAILAISSLLLLKNYRIIVEGKTERERELLVASPMPDRSKGRDKYVVPRLESCGWA
jgi:hypothetical protein